MPAHVVLQVTRLPEGGSTALMSALIELIDPVGSGVDEVNLAVLQARICQSSRHGRFTWLGGFTWLGFFDGVAGVAV